MLGLHQQVMAREVFAKQSKRKLQIYMCSKKRHNQHYFTFEEAEAALAMDV